MTAATATTSVLDKIAKLLEKAEQTSFEHEQQALVAKATELAVRHQVDEAKVRAARDGLHSRSEQVETREWTERGTYKLQHIQLAHAVAAAHSCQILRVASRNHDRVTLVGFPSDMDVVETLLASLRIQAASALHQWWNGPDGQPHRRATTDSHRRAQRRGFLDGYAARLDERLKQLHRDLNTEDGSGETAVILAGRNGQVAAYVDREFNVKRGRRRKIAAAGFAAGEQAASNADIGVAKLGGRNQPLPAGDVG